jgi:hypothetical protein
MKRLILGIALSLLPLAAYPDTVDLGPHGALSVTPPTGWKLSSHKEDDSGFAITLSPPDGVNAKCLLNVTFVLEPKPVAKETVDEEVLSVCDQFVDQSLEKKRPCGTSGCRAGPTDPTASSPTHPWSGSPRSATSSR